MMQRAGINHLLSNRHVTTLFLLELRLGKKFNASSISFCNFLFRLTIFTVLSLSDDMSLIDMNGYSHDLSSEFVIKVLILGWVSFFLAIMVNCVYYILHPMAPQVHPRNKLKTYLFGKLVAKGDEEKQAFIGDNAYINSSGIQNNITNK